MSCAVNDRLGNSSILIGPRASGKSTLVKRVISEVADCHTSARLEPIFLHGSILSECQAALKFLLAQVQKLVNGPKDGVALDFSNAEEEFSEFVRNTPNRPLILFSFCRSLLIS